jgi:hypothetical protein
LYVASVTFSAIAATPPIDGAEVDLAAVDNRLATIPCYLAGPAPVSQRGPFIQIPNAPAGYFTVEEERLLPVPLAFTPGMVFAVFIKPLGGDLTSYSAGASIQRIADWNA